jgi:cold shock CspA family protein
MKGRIEAFDDHRGDGFMVSEKGDRFFFHCVSIADGSRTITPGQSVTAQRGVGHLGHDEAFEIEKETDA